MPRTGSRASGLLIPTLIVLGPGCPAVRAVDRVIEPANQDTITVHILSDPHCPLVSGGAPTCSTFQAIIDHVNTRVPDLTMLGGDLVIDGHDQTFIDEFLSRWNQIAGEKHFVLGNHEADPSEEYVWADPADHYVPAVQYEPLFGYGTSGYRRWYSIHIGDPPRVAVFALNNNSDSYFPDDGLNYLYCTTPQDSLNHAGSSQRVWLNSEIDALPPTVEVVLVCAHRTYYGVEDFPQRPNILYSGAVEFPEAPAETLRTGAVSLLRDLESIPDRTGVKRVFMISGDQHCFSITHPVLRNARDDEEGIPYVVAGGAGARNGRSDVFPRLSNVPPGVLAAAFDDQWFSARFEIARDRVRFRVHEAYTDTLLYSTSWLLDEALGAGERERAPAGGLFLRVRPNPAVGAAVQIDLRLAGPAAVLPLEQLAIYDVRGRLVRNLFRGAWEASVYRRTWDLTDERGRRVPSGTYFVRTGVEGFVATTTITVVHP